MTAKELKEALANVPDDAEVVVCNESLKYTPALIADYEHYTNQFIIL